jgi:tetratricopeptide (TPR) repeat protein
METNGDRVFPTLTGCATLPQHILQILRHVDTSKQSQALSRRLTQFDQLTLTSFPDQAEQILGSNYAELAKVLHRLAVLYHHREDLEKAEPLYRRALDAANKAVTKSNPELGLILNNLGRLLHGQGKLAEAETLYQRSLEILEQRLGADHPRLATPLANAALLSWDLGDRTKAEQLYLNSIAILRTSLGPEHPKVARAKSKFQAMSQRAASLVG